MTNILFVCGKARMRSPTAADLAAQWPDIQTDFAGLTDDADEVLNRARIDWAGKIFVMENRQKKRLLQKIGPDARGLKLSSLDIPDRFTAHDPELIKILMQKLTSFFGPIS